MKRRAREARRQALMARFVVPVLILRQVGLLVAALLMLPFRLIGLVAGFLWETVMPKTYEKMRESFKREGLSDAAAKTKAAKLYNASRKPGQKPVTRKAD